MLLWDTFFEAGEAKLKDGNYPNAEKLLKSALGEAATFEASDPRLLKTLLALIKVYHKSKRPKEAKPHLDKAEALVDAEPGLGPESKSLVIEALLEQLKFSDPDPAAESALHERLVAVWQTAGDEHQGRLLESLLVLAESLRRSGTEAEARLQLLKALAVAEEADGKDSESVDRVLALLIDSYQRTQNYAEAEERARRRLEIQLSRYGEDDVRVAKTLSRLSSLAEKQRRMPEALSLAERAASIPGEERTFFYLSYVDALLRSGAPAEALAKLITLEKGNVHGDQVWRYEVQLMRAYRGVDDRAALKEQAETISEDVAFDPLSRLEAYVIRAELAEKQDESRIGRFLDKIVELDNEELDDHGDLMARIAHLARSADRRNLSEGFFDRAISAQSKDLDTNDPRSVTSLYDLGAIQERRRLLADAVNSWEKSLELLRRHNGNVDTPAEERRLRILLVEKLADIYIRQRRWERAEQAWRSLVRSSPANSSEHARGRVGMVKVYAGSGEPQKAIEYLQSSDNASFEESLVGRALSDTAFMLEVTSLAELGKVEEANRKRDLRFSRRGGSENCSLIELYASCALARAGRDENRFVEDGRWLVGRKPEGSFEQTLLSRFYVLLAENNARYYPPEPVPFELTPLQAYERAIHWAIEANGEIDQTVAELYEESAKAAVAESAWDEAERATRKSLELYEALKGARSPLLLSSLQRLGELHLGKGQLDEAVESLDRALALARDHLKPQDVQVRELLRSLIEAHRRRGEFQESRSYLNQLLGLYKRFDELGVEGKLDDLLRGIRLLLGDEGDHSEQLEAYLDEATDLALARGPIAELSLAYCLGQKARLVGSKDPDQAVALLRQQASTLEEREEAPEFLPDQLLLARFLLFRGQPKGALALLRKLTNDGWDRNRSSSSKRKARILEARAYAQLQDFQTLGQELDDLLILVERDSQVPSGDRAEVLSLKLSLFCHRPDLLGEEEAATTYAELDQIVETGDWSHLDALHLVRERRHWELSRIAFETKRLAPAAAVERVGQQVDKLRGDSSRHPLPLADGLTFLGQLEEQLGSPEMAYDHYLEARKLYEKHGDGNSLARAHLMAALGRVAEILEKREAAVEACREAVAGLEFHLGSKDRHLVPVFLGLGRLGRATRHFDDAETALQQAVTIVSELEEQLPLALRSDVYRELAALYSEQERFREAREIWVKLREMWEDSGELLPTAWLEAFGSALVADDAFAEALQFFLDTLPLRMGQGEDKELLDLYALWLELTAQCKSESLARESAGHLLEVREVVRGSFPEEPEPEFELAWSRVLLGYARLHLSKLYDGSDTVTEDLEEALRVRESHLGPEATPVGDVLTLRADLAFWENDLSTAENCLTRALNIVKSNLGPDTWEVAEILLQLATVYFKKQRFSPTEAVLQRTLELCRTLLEEDDRRWIKVCHLRGKLSLELGRPAEAYTSLERALSLCEKYDRKCGRSLLVASGRAALLTDHPDRALKLFLQAEEHFPSELDEWDEEVEEVELALGELLLENGRFEEANQRINNVLTQQENRFGYGDPALVRVYRALGRTACGMGDLDTAAERLEVALALQEEELFTPFDLFEPYYELARLLREEGSEERACNILEENLERARPSGRYEKIAQMSHLLALSKERRGDLAAAEAAWRETIENLETALEMAPGEKQKGLYEKLLEPLSQLAALLTSHRRYTAAEELTKRRLKYTELLAPGEIAVAEVLFDLAELYRVQELYREAGELHLKVLTIRRAELGKDHPQVAKSLRAMGQITLGEGDIEEARSFLSTALTQQTENLGESHPDLADTLFALGDLSLAEEDFEKAEELYRRALELLEQNYGQGNFRTAQAWTALARLYERKQQWSKAQPLLGMAVESVEAVLGPSHLEVADLLEKTAKVYLVAGSVDQVAEPLERALQIRLDRLGEDHPATARVLKLQGELSELMGDIKAARKLYGRADTIISEFHGSDSAARLPYRLAYERTLLELGEFEQADSHLEVMQSLCAGEDHESQLQLAEVRQEMARLALARGELSKAEAIIKEVLDVRSRLLPSRSEPVASAFETLARIHRADGREVTASALAERALDALNTEEESGEGRASVVVSKARLQTLIARIELEQGNNAEAIASANAALNGLRDLLGDQHPGVAEVLHLLGEVAQAERKLEKAEAFFDEAMAKWEAFFGSSHPQVCRAVASLAQLYQQQGRLTLAENFHQRNLVSLEGRYGSTSPILVDTLLGLGKLCRSQGNAVQAEQHLKRAAEIQGVVAGGTDRKMGEVLHTLALVYQDQRNFIAAEALLRKAMDIRGRTTDDDSTEITESKLALARLYRTSGKVEEAEPLLKDVLEWRIARLGDEHPEVASLLREMAELYADQKEYLKAQSLVKKALGIYGEALGHRNLELVGPLRQLARLLEASGETEEAETHRKLAEELMTGQ